MVDYVRNDYGLFIAFEINDQLGENVDLTSSTVTFKMAPVATNIQKVSGTCTIDTALTGLCHYTFVAGDLDTAGEFNFELEIVYAGKTITAPSEELIIVSPDITT